MDRREAQSVLGARVAQLKARTYLELKALLQNPDCFEVEADSGTVYQIEWEAF